MFPENAPGCLFTRRYTPSRYGVGHIEDSGKRKLHELLYSMYDSSNIRASAGSTNKEHEPNIYILGTWLLESISTSTSDLQEDSLRSLLNFSLLEICNNVAKNGEKKRAKHK